MGSLAALFFSLQYPFIFILEFVGNFNGTKVLTSFCLSGESLLIGERLPEGKFSFSFGGEAQLH